MPEMLSKIEEIRVSGNDFYGVRMSDAVWYTAPACILKSKSKCTLN